MVRAVGAQGTIIGPAHAITAALSSLKGAAWLVRRGSSSAVSGGDVVAAGAYDGRARQDGEMDAATAPRETSGVSTVVDGSVGENMSHRTEPETLQGDKSAASFFGGDEAGGVPVGAVRDVAESVLLTAGQGPVFGDEASRYGTMLESMLKTAVQARRFVNLWSWLIAQTEQGASFDWPLEPQRT